MHAMGWMGFLLIVCNSCTDIFVPFNCVTLTRFINERYIIDSTAQTKAATYLQCFECRPTGEIHFLTMQAR